MQKAQIMRKITFVSLCLVTEMCCGYVRVIPYSPATPGALGVTAGGATITRNIPSFYRNPPEVLGLPSEFKVVWVQDSGMYLYNKYPSRLYLFTNMALLPALKQVLQLPTDPENTLGNNAVVRASGDYGLMIPSLREFLFAEYRSGYPTKLYLCRFITNYYQCAIVANSAAPITPHSTVFKSS